MKNLYLVEFGKPSLSGFSSFNDPEPLFVLAMSYEEAVYMAQNNRKGVSKSILDSDGSLNLSQEDNSDTIRNVKLISNNILS